MNSIALFLLKVVNKLFLRRTRRTLKGQVLFDYCHEIAIDGMGYGGIGDVRTSGEQLIPNILQKQLTGPYIIFDVGANTGQYQQLITDKMKGTDYHVHSFEPSPAIFERLTSNSKSSVTNWNFGFGEKTESLTLYKDSEESMLSSLYTRGKSTYFQNPTQSKEKVELSTIDEFCEKNGIDQISLMKIDVEGHELFVLKGAMNMLQEGRVELIQFEFGPTNMDSKTYLRDFFDLLGDDYELFRIIPDGLARLPVYSEKLEIFIPQNILAIRKSIQ